MEKAGKITSCTLYQKEKKEGKLLTLKSSGESFCRRIHSGLSISIICLPGTAACKVKMSFYRSWICKLILLSSSYPRQSFVRIVRNSAQTLQTSPSASAGVHRAEQPPVWTVGFTQNTGGVLQKHGVTKSCEGYYWTISTFVLSTCSVTCARQLSNSTKPHD